MPFVIVGIVTGVLGAIATFFSVRQARKSAAVDRKEHQDYWWQHRRRERDTLLESAHEMTRKGYFRAMFPGESPWDYASEFRKYLTRTVRMPTWTSPWSRVRIQSPFSAEVTQVQDFVNITVRVYWWSGEADGVVHRVGRIRHDNDQDTPVFLCAQDDAIDEHCIQQHLHGEGPLVTCLTCFAFPRDPS